jgi:hypothetical protein
MLTETVQYLEGLGFARDGGRIDRGKLIERSTALLLERAVDEDSPGAIEQQAMTVAELRNALVGKGPSDEVNGDLNTLIGTLVGPHGKVQSALEDGHVLCAAPVTRTLTPGEAATVKRSGRFVSSHPDVIERFFWRHQRDKLVRTATRMHESIELAIRRQPELRTRWQETLDTAYTQVEHELPRKAVVS